MEGSADHLVLADLTTLKPASPQGLRKEGRGMVIEGIQASSHCPDTPGGVSHLGNGQSSLPPLQSHRLAVHPSMAEGHLGT